MDGRLKAGPKEFASSRSGALCFLRPVCFNIVQKFWELGKWEVEDCRRAKQILYEVGKDGT